MSRAYRVELSPSVAEVVRRLPPDIKAQIKSALRAIAADPELGVPLQRELAGLREFRVRRFRVVYEVATRQHLLRIVAVGHRRSVYDDLTFHLRRLKR